MLCKLVPPTLTALHDFQLALRVGLYLKETFVTVLQQFRTLAKTSETISMAQLFSEGNIVSNPYVIGS